MSEPALKCKPMLFLSKTILKNGYILLKYLSCLGFSGNLEFQHLVQKSFIKSTDQSFAK